MPLERSKLRRRALEVFGSLFLVPFLATPLTAQTPMFRLSGRVSTDRKEPSIRLVLEESTGKKPATFDATPDSKGNYTFDGLIGRDYRLTAYVDGRKQDTRKLEILCRPGAISMKDFHYGKSASTLMLHYPAEDPDVVDVAEIQSVSRDAQRNYDRAYSDYLKGNLRNAIPKLEVLVENSPRYYKAHALLGLSYQDAGCHGDAEAEYAVAAALNPRAVHPLLNLASSQLRGADLPDRRDELLMKALATLNKALQVRPNSALVYSLLGSAQLKQEAEEEAEKSLLKALQIQDSLGIARVMLGKLYGNQKKWTAAAEQFRKYLADNPYAEDRGVVRDMLSEVVEREKGTSSASP